MTNEQKARIHNILYSTDSREELAQRIVALEDERDKVSKERDYLLMNANPTATELRRVRRAWKNDRADNAKLREFVYDVWNDMNVYYTQHESPDSSDMDFYRDRMRELGIEVDE